MMIWMRTIRILKAQPKDCVVLSSRKGGCSTQAGLDSQTFFVDVYLRRCNL